MGATVTVACKLPHGLHLDIGEKRVTIAGANTSNVIGGHGITENVDKEFFDKWLSLHKEAPYVKQQLIFSHDKEDSAKAKAKERKDVKTGFEGIDPAKPGAGIEAVNEKAAK